MSRVLRVGSVVRLLPDKREQYERLHREVWPELLALFRAYHVRRFSIYHLDGYLFSTKEYTGGDYAGDMARLCEEPLMKRWFALTDPCQMPLDGRRPDSAGPPQTPADDGNSGGPWADMDEIFYME